MTAKEFAESEILSEYRIDLNGRAVDVIFNDLEALHRVAHEMLKRPYVNNILVWHWRDNKKEILGVYRKTT